MIGTVMNYVTFDACHCQSYGISLNVTNHDAKAKDCFPFEWDK